MRAGKLRNAAKIQSNSPSRDAIGGEAAAWSDFVATWYCELRDVGGRERLRGHTVHADASLVAIGRYVAGVTSKMRVTLGTRTFDILNAADPDGRGRELILDLLERNV